MNSQKNNIHHDNLAAAFLPMIDAMEDSFAKTLEDIFDQQECQEILAKTRRAFEAAEPLLPDVGPDSPWLKNLIGITYEIGLWKELQKRGLVLKDISVLTQKTLARLSLQTIPSNQITQIRDTLCSPLYVKKIAEASHNRPYQDDWIFDYVLPEKNEEFTVGMNIHTCPVKLICQRLDAEKFFPYLCLNDYVMHGMLGISLVRTQTLANGDPCCDFRLTPEKEAFINLVTDPAQLDEFKQ